MYKYVSSVAREKNILNFSDAVYFACCFVWVWNLVADIAEGKEAESVWEHGVEENICT